jgi:hypothetical protein
VPASIDDAETHFADAVDFALRAKTPGALVHSRLERARMLLRRGTRPEDVPRTRALLKQRRPALGR